PVKMSFMRMHDRTRTIVYSKPEEDRPADAASKYANDAREEESETPDARKDDDPLPVNEDDQTEEEEEKKEPTPREARRQRRGKTRERITVASTKEIMEAIHAATGYRLSARRAETLIPFLEKKGRAMY